MEGSYNYRFPRPAVTTDCVIFGFDGNKIKVLLITRENERFKGKLALPGGFLEMEETLEACALRELKEETGVTEVRLREAGTLSGIDRDPRTRVISIVFYSLLNSDRMYSGDIIAQSDAKEISWVELDELLSGDRLAFDHKKAVQMAFANLAGRLNKEPVAFELLNDVFTIKELQRVYELLLNRSFDRANFHKKMVGDPTAKGKVKKNGRKKNTGILTDTGEVMKDTKHKPAKYYIFDLQKYNELMEKEDFNFGF